MDAGSNVVFMVFPRNPQKLGKGIGQVNQRPGIGPFDLLEVPSDSEYSREP